MPLFDLPHLGKVSKKVKPKPYKAKEIPPSVTPVKDELGLGLNAITVLQKRYLLRNGQGRIVETPKQLFRRVARAIAEVDYNYGASTSQVKILEEEFYNLMARKEFMPNTPTLMNAGTPLAQLAACFVLPIEDSLPSIFKALADSALIEQSGGGVGYSFSRLRPKGDYVKSTQGVASGPCTFMEIFDTKTNVIRQGGRRRGALMGILKVDHPDIVEFITSKAQEGKLRNFNISVAVTEKFMSAVKKDKEYGLINPRTKQVVRKLKARWVWDLITSYAWKTGDPGLIFIDEINKTNPTKHIGEIESTNPCAEQPLHPYEPCNLGSINLSKMLTYDDKDVAWNKLRETVRKCIHFLDNVIDASKYPIPEITHMAKANRRIGLGVMGFADMLCLLRIPYNSDKAIQLGEKIMKFINDEAHKMSSELGKKRGSFPNFKGSLWDKQGYKHMRNATCTTVAPTGTISIIAGCSSGIEPLFAVTFMRNVLEGTHLLEVNPIFEQVAREEGFYSEKLMRRIAKSGAIAKFKEIPSEVRKTFVTALEIPPEFHVKMQAAFQRHCDNAVSKTINFPHDAKVADVKKAYELAYKLKCKGITIYRYGSKSEQVLYIGKIAEKGEPYVVARPETAGWCASPLCPNP
jgi:ribonucleoside-diphosphate reductase alpha chain